MSRVLAAGATVVAGAIALVIGAAEPALADNCSGLSDCSPGMLAGMLLLFPLLLIGLLAALAGGFPWGGGSGGGGAGGGSGGGAGGGGGSGGGGGGGSGGGGSGGGGGGQGGGGGNNPAPPPPAFDPNPDPGSKPPQDPPNPQQQREMDAAQQRLNGKKGQPPENWVKDINPTNSKLNCVEAAKAVDQTLGGNPKPSGPVNRGQDGRDLQDAYPGKGQPQQSPLAIEQDLLKQPGSRAIVTVNEGGSGHTFNVVNDNGTIKWIDGQSGRVSNTPGGVLGPAGYNPNPSTLEYLKTWP